MDTRVKNLSQKELENVLEHLQISLQILNYDKLSLSELNNAGEDLTLNLEFIMLKLFSFIADKKLEQNKK